MWSKPQPWHFQHHAELISEDFKHRNFLFRGSSRLCHSTQKLKDHSRTLSKNRLTLGSCEGTECQEVCVSAVQTRREGFPFQTCHSQGKYFSHCLVGIKSRGIFQKDTWTIMPVSAEEFPKTCRKPTYFMLSLLD